jgi:hypothetical protein
VITLVVEGGRKLFHGDLEPGGEAYIDADWLVDRTERTVPLVLARGGSLTRSWDGATFDYPASNAQAGVAGAFWLVAEAAALRAGAAERPAVEGGGVVAALARHLLGLSGSADTGGADLIIEPRSDRASLEESTGRVDDLGTVVLAGVADAAFRFDLYPDVHVRGLRLIALPLPLDLQPAAGFEPSLPPAIELATVRVDEPIPDGASWYRITAD